MRKQLFSINTMTLFLRTMINHGRMILRLTVRKGYIYGRGVDDDKGHITARLTALRKVYSRGRRPSC